MPTDLKSLLVYAALALAGYALRHRGVALSILGPLLDRVLGAPDASRATAAPGEHVEKYAARRQSPADTLVAAARDIKAQEADLAEAKAALKSLVQ